jgi:protein-S-isoprenylcysteine O-methyltransferase Ste14
MIHLGVGENTVWRADVGVRAVLFAGSQGWFEPRRVMFDAWVVFAAVWLVAAFWRKRLEKREPKGERLLHLAWMGLAAYLMTSDQTWWPAFDGRFLPNQSWITELGAWTTVAGAAFAIWARVHLGSNWSGNVTIREGHSLIRSGPYTYIRHPIYTGIILAVTGTVLVVGKYRALVGFAMVLIALARKARKEESFLGIEFGPAFEEHKRRTGFFLPRLS